MTNNIKWNIGWGYVSLCNMKCEFCYSKNVRKTEDIVSLDIAKKFVDNNFANISSINYGTGENTLKDEWFELVKYIGENYKNIKQALTTNGYVSVACKNPTNSHIVKKYISEIDVSLDFADNQRHNKFRGNYKAFEMAINTLKFCKEHGIQSTIVFLGTKEVVQQDNLDGIFNIAKTYNALLRSNIYRPTNGINQFTKKFILSFEDIITTLQYISNNFNIIKISDQLLSPVLFNEKSIDHSGISSLRILCDGSITPSTYLIDEKYRKNNILDVCKINNINFSEELNRKCIPDDCIHCSFVKQCQGGVIDRRLLWYGTLKKRDPYCPYRYAKEWTNKYNIKLSKSEEFHSVHDDYLPTMFFKN